MAPWRYALASVMGTSHVVSGDPCQDASQCVVVKQPDDREVLIAVACDGAGSAKLSQVGSAETCRFLVDRIGDLVASQGLEITPEAGTEIVLEAQANLRRVAAGREAQLRDLACTLVVGIIGPENSVFLQVGDGVVVVGPRSEPESEFSWVFWPERGEYANTTTFLSDERVAEHIQFDATRSPVDEVAVLTDGIQSLVLDYRSQSAHSPFFQKMLSPLRSMEGSGHAAELSTALAKYLDGPAVNERTDDDKTLILASRRGL